MYYLPEKRKYTFRKNEDVPYSSGSIMHRTIKNQKRMTKNMDSAFDVPKSKRRKQSLF